MEKLLRMRLDLFGEGEGGAAAAGGAAGASGAAGDAGGTASGAGAPGGEGAGTGADSMGVSGIPTRQEGSRQKIFPAVPRQEIRRAERARPAPAARAQETAQQDQQPQQQEESFDSLIRGKYKKEYGAAVQAAIQERFKNQRNSEDALRRANETLASVAPFFGIEADAEGNIDLDKLTSAIQNDDRLYEEEALQKGIPVSTLKHMKQLEAKERQQEAEKRRSLADEQLRRHFEGLKAQAEELKQSYPDFDLMAEIQANPVFARMTSPGGGLSVRQAYMACHGEELMRQAAQQTEAATKRNMSRAIQSGSVRPQENGMTQSGGGPMHTDPHYMSRAERDEIRRRVRAGERIVP